MIYRVRECLPTLAANAHNIPSAQKGLSDSSKQYIEKMNSTFFDLVKKTPFEIHETDSCIGPDGSEVDASTLLSQVGAPICVSVARLTKVAPMDLFAETSALLIHEFSHQFGADETAAVKLQTEFLGIFPIVDLFEGAGWLQFQLQVKMVDLQAALSILGTDLELAKDGSQPTQRLISFCVYNSKLDSENVALSTLLIQENLLPTPLLLDEERKSLSTLMQNVSTLVRAGNAACDAGKLPNIDPATYLNLGSSLKELNFRK